MHFANIFVQKYNIKKYLLAQPDQEDYFLLREFVVLCKYLSCSVSEYDSVLKSEPTVLSDLWLVRWERRMERPRLGCRMDILQDWVEKTLGN